MLSHGRFFYEVVQLNLNLEAGKLLDEIGETIGAFGLEAELPDFISR